MKKKKILFVYDIPDENYWKDGLWAAVELLKKDFEVFKLNLSNPSIDRDLPSWPDFVLGWGAFNSPVEHYVSQFNSRGRIKKGLCLGGYSPYSGQKYDILFYEVENWSKNWLNEHEYKGKTKHAFGINTDIFKPLNKMTVENQGDYSVKDWYPKIWDYLTVGAFAYWKRQELLLQKEGSKIAVGQIQQDNLSESLDIIGNLIVGRCGILDMVIPTQLAQLYNLSKTCYIPATIFGGGERAILEARACGIDIEVQPDNQKLQELITSPIYSHLDYAKALKKGILECLN